MYIPERQRPGRALRNIDEMWEKIDTDGPLALGSLRNTKYPLQHPTSRKLRICSGYNGDTMRQRRETLPWAIISPLRI